MIEILERYFHWLHGQWPAGTVEKLPQVDADGRTNIPGLFVTGDLTGSVQLPTADDGVQLVFGVEYRDEEYIFDVDTGFVKSLEHSRRVARRV